MPATSGGSQFDRAWGIAVDAANNAYITGYTDSPESSFPVAVGPDLTYNGGPEGSAWDAFVAKVKADGTGLVYAGYIGGSGYDGAKAIALDGVGSAYVTGETYSDEATFPVTVGPDLTYNGGHADAFVAKVKEDGTGLAYAGYIGGSPVGYSTAGDYGLGIAVDAAGSAHVVGMTNSPESTFPVRGGPDLTHNGYDDTFVAKVEADGGGLAYCGYIGGAGNDATYVDGAGIALDSAGAVYVVGSTSSTAATFPVTVGPDLTHNSDSWQAGWDAYVAKLRTSSALPGFHVYLPLLLRH